MELFAFSFTFYCPTFYKTDLCSWKDKACNGHAKPFHCSTTWAFFTSTKCSEQSALIQLCFGQLIKFHLDVCLNEANWWSRCSAMVKCSKLLIKALMFGLLGLKFLKTYQATYHAQVHQMLPWCRCFLSLWVWFWIFKKHWGTGIQSTCRSVSWKSLICKCFFMSVQSMILESRKQMSNFTSNQWGVITSASSHYINRIQCCSWQGGKETCYKDANCWYTFVLPICVVVHSSCCGELTVDRQLSCTLMQVMQRRSKWSATVNPALD